MMCGGIYPVPPPPYNNNKGRVHYVNVDFYNTVPVSYGVVHETFRRGHQNAFGPNSVDLPRSLLCQHMGLQHSNIPSQKIMD